MAMDVWIGLAQVEPHVGNDSLEGAKGAFVNVLALAESESGWRAATESALTSLGFSLRSAERVEPFWLREHEANPDEYLRHEAEEVRLRGEVRFGSFHAFEDDGLAGTQQ